MPTAHRPVLISIFGCLILLYLLSRRVSTTWDAASRQIGRIDARLARVTLVWDNGGREVGRIYSDGTRVTSGFDQVGHRRFLGGCDGQDDEPTLFH